MSRWSVWAAIENKGQATTMVITREQLEEHRKLKGPVPVRPLPPHHPFRGGGMILFVGTPRASEAPKSPTSSPPNGSEQPPAPPSPAP
jgi:hypothetical protein